MSTMQEGMKALKTKGTKPAIAAGEKKPRINIFGPSLSKIEVDHGLVDAIIEGKKLLPETVAGWTGSLLTILTSSSEARTQSAGEERRIRDELERYFSGEVSDELTESQKNEFAQIAEPLRRPFH